MKKTKMEKIYEYLDEGGELTSAKARNMFGVRALSDTTYRLRLEGAPIACRKVVRGKRTTYVHFMANHKDVSNRSELHPHRVRNTGYTSLNG